MADYMATGLWHSEGYPVDPSDYNLSRELLNQFAAWSEWYEYNEDYKSSEDERTPFDTKAFTEYGYEIAKLLKYELPDYEIEYYKEDLNEYVTITSELDYTNG